MRIFKLICFFFTSLTYAGNTGAGTAPISPTQSQYNSQWTSYRQPPKTLQKEPRSSEHYIPSYFIDRQGKRWSLFQEGGGVWGADDQGQIKPYDDLIGS